MFIFIIFCFLVELVRFYVGIVILIVNYSYIVGQFELIKEDCSVLVFVLDYLFLYIQNVEDKDIFVLVCLFFVSLVVVGSGIDVQVVLVNEVKVVFGWVLVMVESIEKYVRFQVVMCIISIIMEFCFFIFSFYSSVIVKIQYNGMNNIIWFFLKKGLVNDLVRVFYSLDLFSFNMVNIVNVVLKFLEIFFWIVNQFSSFFGSKSVFSKNKFEQDV